jgi:8-oxo-dGTP diphosphatase
MISIVDVTAALIEVNGKCLVCRRKEGKDLAGKWELPGGKVEYGEGYRDCLQRELKEELEIDAIIGHKLGIYEHDYGNKKIRLHVYGVTRFSGEPKLNEHDKLEWALRGEVVNYDLCPVDVLFAKRLATFEVLF